MQAATTSSVVTDTAGTTTTGATQDAGLTAAQLAANGDVAGEVPRAKTLRRVGRPLATNGTLTFYVAQNTDGAAGAAAYTYDKVIVTSMSASRAAIWIKSIQRQSGLTPTPTETPRHVSRNRSLDYGHRHLAPDHSAQDLAKLNAYEQQVDAAISECHDAASTLGTAQKRIQAQASFVSSLQTSINNGVGSLVDADMNRGLDPASGSAGPAAARRAVAFDCKRVRAVDPEALPVTALTIGGLQP